MKYLLLIFYLFLSFSSFCQKKDFQIHNISLPPEISYYDNQFSGLYIHAGNLFLMSESRLQDSAEAKLYAIKLADIEIKMKDTAYVLPFRKYHIYNLDILREQMKRKGDVYEGLEAMVFDRDELFFSVETSTPSSNCYLLRGKLVDSLVILNKKFLLKMPKPELSDGSHIYNAGFEALSLLRKDVFLSFFEYNYFLSDNYVRWITSWSFANKGKYHPISIDRLPFRITDITQISENSFTALNFFYKGTGKDEIYRVPAGDENEKLIKTSGGYLNYFRLVNITYADMHFKWYPLWEFPKEYMGYNWEGITAYKKGYFVMNDKYTAARPYRSVLLYLEKQ